jgi:hypothetical protein
MQVLGIHDETDIGNPEEKREVQIGREMIAAIDLLPPLVANDVSMRNLKGLANELIAMHQRS